VVVGRKLGSFRGRCRPGGSCGGHFEQGMPRKVDMQITEILKSSEENFGIFAIRRLEIRKNSPKEKR
jgi:hypothetical protein